MTTTLEEWEAIAAGITDEDLGALEPDEQAALLRFLQQKLDANWSFAKPNMRNERALLAEALVPHVDWLLFGGAAGGGKALPLDEVVPTPGGWTPVGELAVGDELFDEHGCVTRVVFVHPVVRDGVAYRLTFDDGTSMVANDEHRWLTFDADDLSKLTRRDPEWQARRRERRSSRATGARGARVTEMLTARNQAKAYDYLPLPEGSVRTTAEIAATLTTPRGRRNHAVPVCGAIDLPEVELPIDPYVLGVWLGDGCSGHATITASDDDAGVLRGEIEAAGYPTSDRSTSQTFGVLGLWVTLKREGLIRNKHVPGVYLRGSAKQRLALLQGLMDTDGTCDRTGSVEFTNTNRSLAEAVVELARSLGYKATLRESRAKLNGKDCGPVWDVKWTPVDPVFRLPRKLARQKAQTRRTTRFRYVTACEQVPFVPMRCITVENRSGLFLAGRQFVVTHNSEMGLKHAYELSRSIPGHHALVLRTSKPELRRSLVMRSIARFRQLGHVADGSARLRNQDNMLAWHFASGSLIEFGYLSREMDVGQFLSAEYDLVWFDEATQFAPEWMLSVIGRLRTTIDKARLGARPHALFTTNPGSQGHAWFYERFVKPTEYGRKVVVYDIAEGMERARVSRVFDAPADPVEAAAFAVPEQGDDEITVGFVPSKATDNPWIDRGYRRYLSALPETERRQKRDGDWDTFSGQFFSEWDRDVHVVEPFEIPAGWVRARGLDYGYADPFACVWGAWSNDGALFVYRELYGSRMTPLVQAQWVAALSVGADGRPERYQHTVADPSVFSKTGVGEPVAAQWRDAGLHVVRANNDRVSGWAVLREYLRAKEPDGRPSLFVFSTCVDTVRTVPLMQQSKSKPEDLDTKSDDHLVDALRYLVMTRPRSAARVKHVDSPGQQGQLERMFRRLARQERGRR